MDGPWAPSFDFQRGDVQLFDLETAKRRSFALDLIRVFAAFSVISVHFLMNTGFYGQPVLGKKMFALCLIRTFFSCCVPLFLVLTGWLMCRKKLEKRFYYGLSGTLATYVLAGCACLLYKRAVLHAEGLTLLRAVYSLLGFSASDYAWYVEMYIGLFLLIPFLNLIYNGLDSKKKKDILLLTLLALTVLPTFFNSFNPTDPAWWAAPAAGYPVQLLPRWWLRLYPVTYYFTGCYLREYGLPLKTRTIALLLSLFTIGFGIFNYWQSYGAGFVTGPYVDWGGFEPYLLTILLFTLLSRADGDRVPLPLRYGLWKVSDLCLGIYLVSYIFDTMFYPWLNQRVPAIPDRLFWFPVMTVCVFVCSMLLSLVLHWLQKLLGRLFIRFARAAHTAARGDPDRLRRSKARIGHAAFALCFASVVALALWKAPYGFGSTDDAFYLTIPHRLSMGDALFTDEWHVSQMSGLLTLPFVWVFRTVTGSTDGIMLASRYFYVFFHGAMTLLVYSRLRRYGPAAKIAALSWLLFTPFDVMVLSYNTMSMEFILLSGVLLATAEKPWHAAAAGVCLAAGVLCCPYFAAAYFLYAACVGVRALARKLRPGRDGGAWAVLDPSRLLWLTAGTAAVAVLFLAYVLASCGIGGLLSNLPHILSDPEHPPVSLLDKLRYALHRILTCHPWFKLALAGYALLLLGMLADRKRGDHRAFYLILSCVLALAVFAMFYPDSVQTYYNAIMVPLLFPGFTAYLLCRDRPRALFAGVFLAGLIYAAAVTLGSNNYFYSFAMACAVANTASLLFLGRLLRELRERPDPVSYGLWLRRGAAASAALVVAVLLVMQVRVKARHCLADEPPSALTCQLSGGPAHGIRTTRRIGSYYSRISGELQYYKTRPVGRLLILNERTWCWLAADPMEYATFSAWISGENQTALDRLDTYFRVNPDKVPDYIYLSKDSDFEDPEAILAAAQARGYALTETELSWYLERP